MKRLRKNTPLSMTLMALSGLSLGASLFTGNLIFAAAVVVLFFLSFTARKPESYDEYRSRYNQQYGLAEKRDQENDEQRQI